LGVDAKSERRMSTGLEPVDPSGLVLGRYRPLRPLGSGGSGTVWLARDDTSGLEVALKIIAKEGRAAPRAEREAEAATRLRHPHCLRAYGLESDDKHLYIPYEYVPGSTLRQVIRSGELRDEGAVEAAAQILEALAFAHAQGIVHRDVKPANVLVVDGESISVRLFDFGLAQLADAETLTAVGDVPGTLAYISPERLHGETAGPPADVWAAGVLLWEALSGHHPFWRASLLETGEEIKSGAPSIGEARPDLPARLIAAVDRALSVDPAQRPSATALSTELRRSWLEREPRPKRSRARVRIEPKRALMRGGAPALAALVVGWTAAALPFYPARWPLLLAGVAAALTAARARLGLAFTLAVPVFPLGNVSLGLAVAYGGLAVAWLALMWGDPWRGLLFGSGIVLGPIGLLGLVPLAVLPVRNALRRTASALAAVLLAGVVAGVHGSAIPFSGGSSASLGVAGSEHPVGALEALWQWLLSNPALAIEALILASTAGALPHVMRRADLSIAAFAAGLLAATLLAAPHAGAVPLVFAGWLTYLVLTVQSRRLPQRLEQRRFGTVVAQTRVSLRRALSRVHRETSRFPRTPSPSQRYG
jgi:protein kinase-like protein